MYENFQAQKFSKMKSFHVQVNTPGTPAPAVSISLALALTNNEIAKAISGNERSVGVFECKLLHT